MQIHMTSSNDNLDVESPTSQTAKTDGNDTTTIFTNDVGEEGVIDVGVKDGVTIESKSTEKSAEDEDPHFETERYFLPLLVISSCVVAFAHGGNDVANCIGPLGAILEIAKSNQVDSKPDVPTWLVIMGGIAFAVGILMWGYRVVETVGNGLTKLTVARAFCAQLGAGVAIMAASSQKMPISTSHTIIGSVIFLAMADGSKVEWHLMKKVFGSWVITIPCAASIAAVSFIIIDWINLKNGN